MKKLIAMVMLAVCPLVANAADVCFQRSDGVLYKFKKPSVSKSGGGTIQQGVFVVPASITGSTAKAGYLTGNYLVEGATGSIKYDLNGYSRVAGYDDYDVLSSAVVEYGFWVSGISTDKKMLVADYGLAVLRDSNFDDLPGTDLGASISCKAFPKF